MVEQVEELEAGHTTKRAVELAIATNTEAKRQKPNLVRTSFERLVRYMKR